METKYNIIVSTDPYNASRHYNGQEVIAMNGGTPTSWVYDTCYSLKAALSVLERLVESRDDRSYYDDDSIKELRKGLVDDGITIDEAEMRTSWYEGPGYYEDGYIYGSKLVYRTGELDCRDDVLNYEIVVCKANEEEPELEPAENE